MCEKIIGRIPSLTAEERLQLRHNCRRAVARSADSLVVQEAKRVLAELDALEQRETQVLARLPVARRIEYAFRRLPASERERRAIRLLHELSAAAEASGGAGTREPEGDSVWHRHIGEMCRTRRHLLRDAGQERWDEVPAADPAALAAALLQVDAADGAVRLRPEAVEAFCHLGYVGARAA
ncbi:MAG TPA: hypothetical protein VES39_12730 [Rhodospirillales bacterium]|nr:hypothetical protein [Rhodospirillales bacterium]